MIGVDNIIKIIPQQLGKLVIVIFVEIQGRKACFIGDCSLPA